MNLRRRVVGALYASEWLKRILFNPLVEYHQWRLHRFVRDAAKSLDNGSRVIDVGAGELKYKSEFAHCAYVSNDLCVGDDGWNYQDIDIVSSAYDIPVEDNSFDAAICIQVLEHLDNPDDAIREFHRILKPGGHLFLSAPLLAGEHQQPFDFFRYTRYSLAALGERHGFSVESIQPHGGGFIALEVLFWSLWWEILPLRRQSLPRYLAYVICFPIRLITGTLALILDPLDRKKSMTINYDVVLRRLS